ncbi:Inactive receptor-like protein kinase [Actinidia chinensis var. chinensis]|uniref:Inactive receptor-like protein kinase n=1 Tax=Actinidia chinensis var. chinensis TaxID=1590841 RepID=A0A2R6PLK7_ACTCC|nr:Inactive receptor-like protein kinase [Actinidia chinensis var. chinensis]
MMELREHRLAILAVLVCLLYQDLNLCWSLNDEGLALLRFRERVVSDPFGALSNWNDDVGVIDPCSWFGVECSDGNVVVLNLKDFCLGGTLAPDLGNLVHIKSIMLRNNSFYGTIPKEIGELKELEVLDLGYNNFSGPLPSNLGSNLSLTIFLLDNNDLFGNLSPEILDLKMISEVQVDENQLSNSAQRSSCSARSISRNIGRTGDAAHRRLQKWFTFDLPKPSSPSPSPSLSSESSFPPPTTSAGPSTVPNPKLNSPPAESPSRPVKSSKPKDHQALILSAAIGGPVLLVIFVIGILFCQGKNIAAVRPRTTGLSGQLQKAFVAGVPKLKRSELETACEDFSNVIGSSSIGAVYKGTLSSGVEIAVASIPVAAAKDWSNNLETQFRNKIDSLSKVNHKNFVNLLGFCEEDEPFTRMLVFEYAPNGTLFEHLHIKEAEHLDWGMRMRIIMGMAYCLEHVHQLTPPIVHKNLNSSSINLTEDYAAKISDFGVLSETPAEIEPNPESNIYSFGVILFETITGRLPYSVDRLEDWASDYLSGEQPFIEMVDPTLKSFQLEQLEQIGEVIRSCVHPDPKQRPQMREVTARLREITAIAPDGAVPKLSPLWWAELEILSTEAN